MMAENVNENRFLNRVAVDLLNRFSNELQNVAVVFNNKRPQVYLKKYLAEVSGKPIWSPQFFTIQQYLALGTPLVPANQLKQFFVLFTCYNQQMKDAGREEVSPDEFYPLAEIILSDFSQVDYYLAQPAEVFRLIENIAELQFQFPNFGEEELQFLKTFWSSFSEQKQNHIQQKFIELWQRMPELYDQFHKKLAEESLVTCAKMYRNLAEGKLSDPEFLKKFQHTVFVGFNALSKAEEKLFKQWQEQGWCSFYFDGDLHYFSNETQEAGYFMRRNVHTVGLANQFKIMPDQLNDPAKEFTIIQALGNVAQGKLLSKILSREKNAAPNSKAVILADEQLLLPALQTISDEGVNVTMGYPFEQSALYGLCDLWLGIQESLTLQPDISYKQLLSFLFNPLIPVDPAQRNYFHNQIMEEKRVSFKKEDLLQMGKISILTFTPFADAFQAIRNLGSVLLLVAGAEHPLRRIDSLLVTAAVKALNLLADNFEELKVSGLRNLKSKFVLRLIRRALQGLTVPFEGEPLAGLQVMGLLESRNLDFDELVILGVNEGILPKISHAATFIPDNIRRSFGLPILEHQNAISAYLFYRLLHVAKKVTLVYNAITDEKSTGEESRFIKQLQFETKGQFVHLIQQNQSVENPLPLGIVVEKSGAVWIKMEQYFKRNTNPKYDKRISATAFSDYNSCSLRFFYKNIARLKEPKDLPDQIEANLIGSALHTVMEYIYTPVSGKEVTAEFIRQQEKRLPEICKEALEKELRSNHANVAGQTPALQQIVLQVLEQYAIKILKKDEELVPFTIEELENKTDYLSLYTIGTGKQIWLYGIIDRVDLKNGKTRIVDYKTGKDQVKYKDFPSLFEVSGKDQNKALLQTLFYTYVYEQVQQKQQVEPHLYAVRDFKEGTLFKEKHKGGLALKDQNLETFKSLFAGKLQEKLMELFNAEVPFVQTPNLENCVYCPYKDICQR